MGGKKSKPKKEEEEGNVIPNFVRTSVEGGLYGDGYGRDGKAVALASRSIAYVLLCWA